MLAASQAQKVLDKQSDMIYSDCLQLMGKRFYIVNTPRVDRISLDGLTPDQFQQLAELLSDAVLDRLVKIRIWVPSSVELLFDSTIISEKLQSKDLPVSQCLVQFNADIPIMLSAVLMGRQESAARFLTNDAEITEPGFVPDDSEEQQEVIRNELLQRCAVLERQVIGEELRRQYAVKITAKNKILTGTEWEVVQRQSDSSSDSPSALTYANVRLILQNPPINYLQYVGARQESETLTVILTAEEIIDLQANLQDMLTALTNTRY